jgi:hypothetical protein
MPVRNIDIVDDPTIPEVLESFAGGQNSFTRAALLQPSQAAFLENVVILISGQLMKRRGTRNIFSGFVANENEIIQALVYYKTTVDDLVVAFGGGQAYQFSGTDWELYFSANIADPTERIDAVQLTDNLFFTDSTEIGIRLWDGAVLSTVAGSPVATILESIGNRLAGAGVSTIPDALYFSDILDGETWDKVNNQIRIGAGDGTAITALKTWQKQALLVFKEKGVWIVTVDPTKAHASDFTVDVVHNTIGCVARRTVCQVGQDVWFLSRNGIMSVAKQIATSNDVIAIPVSQPVQDIIERIRWDMVYKASAACYNNYYLLSIPVESDEPDTVIAYHYLTGGFTIFTGWHASVFLEQPFEGTTRLLIGCDTGEVRQWLDYRLANEIDPDRDYKDGLQGLPLPQILPFRLPFGFPTVATVLTRGLVFQDPLVEKRGWYCEIELQHGTGTLEVLAVLDGVETIPIRSWSFSVAGFTIPATLPFTLPSRPGWLLKKVPLHQFRMFRELQLKLISESGEFMLRRLSAQATPGAYDAQE